MNLAPSTTPNTSPPNPNPTQNTHYTITNPLTFTTFLDQNPPSTAFSITHLTLAPSPHLGRITSLPHLNDTLGDSLGDASTFAELHSWVTLLQRLSHATPGLRSLTIIFDADMSGRDTHGYRRGVGECLGFIWAIARFRGLEWVDLQGYFPAQWPWYLRGVWTANGQATRIYNRVEAPERVLREWRRGTERLDPREFGWE
ncbi:uncharacterized protein Bfra_010404 [Botrytis fragariae]|uniref:Uncharacterized protein n=1 Tax=Botrytis fragariae TaxID=1964551 RepID=A0A8H6AH81_9HELO|nr:uncharacterized protein Bfra_010404 [Botrytis fragariae]KAF5867430.1 hypothetical protein Bfra_010404 [Botrytis fragariae]